MRILVFSDTHKELSGAIKTINNIIGVDMVLHAGDHASDAMELEKMFPDIKFHYVAGNCDFTKAPGELVIESEGKKIVLTHGHGYAVKYDYDYATIRNFGAEQKADLVVFGHTHVPLCDFSKKPALLNPGSAKSSATFGVIEIESGTLKASICNI